MKWFVFKRNILKCNRILEIVIYEFVSYEIKFLLEGSGDKMVFNI